MLPHGTQEKEQGLGYRWTKPNLENEKPGLPSSQRSDIHEGQTDSKHYSLPGKESVSWI